LLEPHLELPNRPAELLGLDTDILPSQHPIGPQLRGGQLARLARRRVGCLLFVEPKENLVGMQFADAAEAQHGRAGQGDDLVALVWVDVQVLLPGGIELLVGAIFHLGMEPARAIGDDTSQLSRLARLINDAPGVQDALALAEHDVAVAVDGDLARFEVVL